jgi:1-acyl-sn-glycerol-3-phosphate acyltransferase
MSASKPPSLDSSPASAWVALQCIAGTAGSCGENLGAALTGRLNTESGNRHVNDWVAKMMRTADVQLSVEGLEHDQDPSQPLIVMSNHLSLFDIPVLLTAIPGRARMIAKKELFSIPFFGETMRRTGFIFIDRNDRKKASEALASSRSLLASGSRVWIAPEGTRSRSGEMLPFKMGPFRLAIETQTAIWPAIVEGTEQIIAPETSKVRRGVHVRVRFLPIMQVAGVLTRPTQRLGGTRAGADDHRTTRTAFGQWDTNPERLTPFQPSRA